MQARCAQTLSCTNSEQSNVVGAPLGDCVVGLNINDMKMKLRQFRITTFAIIFGILSLIICGTFLLVKLRETT